ncbi:GntR family transcriptional regulator [Streptomyces sp. NPDC047049]|uniref:GntR family transcriptional regulator n=1 Tax=Streptomyces sp. NPDC047049 TaxID=3156688 RepID=UPI0033F3DB8A
MNEAAAVVGTSVDTRRALLDATRRLGHIGGMRAAASPAAVAIAYDHVAQSLDKWLRLAERRREEAAGSHSDRARWDRLINAVTRPRRPSDTSYEGLVLQVSSARELLRALISTEPPSLPIAEVARRIDQQIAAGIYAPGTSLSMRSIADVLCVPVDSVSLALSDLARSGTIEAEGTGRFRIPHPDGESRARQLANWLSELVAAGVYPAGSALPRRRELARVLVTSQEPLSEALCLLVEDGTLECDPQRRPIVRALKVPGHTTTGPLPRLTEPAHDVNPASIRETVRTVHAWWTSRLAPHPSRVDRCIDQLCATAHHLEIRARSAAGAPAAEELRSVIARMKVTAAAVRQAAGENRLWRTACLATAVRDVLAIVERLEGYAEGSAA